MERVEWYIFSLPDIQIKKKKKILRRLRWNFIFSNLICYSFILNGVMTRKIIIIKNKRGSVLAGSWFNVGELKLCNIGDRIHGACQEPNPVIPVASVHTSPEAHAHRPPDLPSGRWGVVCMVQEACGSVSAPPLTGRKWGFVYPSCLHGTPVQL